MTLREWLEKVKRLPGPPGKPGRGTQAWLARTLGVDQGLVSKWVRRVRTPVQHGAAIVRLSGGKVTEAELRRISAGPRAVLRSGIWRKP